MSDTLARSTREAQYIFDNAPMLEQRTGQLLFNSLRQQVAAKVRATNFDPFYRDLSLQEIIDWFENHIIFNDHGIMICVFDGNDILWEEGKDG
jgi:hypothetical protein